MEFLSIVLNVMSVSQESCLKWAMKAVEENLKKRIIARDDKVGICFFNTVSTVPIFAVIYISMCSLEIYWIHLGRKIM